jgi:hypothetical protein
MCGLPRASPRTLNSERSSALQAKHACGRAELPDFDRMPNALFEEWLATSRLTEFQRSELRQAENRVKHYQQAIYWLDLQEATRAQAELNNYLLENSIFMTEDLRQKFGAMNKALQKALTEHEVGTQAKDPALLRSSYENLIPLSDLFSQVESAVQKRLRYEEA